MCCHANTQSNKDLYSPLKEHHVFSFTGIIDNKEGNAGINGEFPLHMVSTMDVGPSESFNSFLLVNLSKRIDFLNK